MAQRSRGRPASASDLLGFPVFVKPARAGSSMGITRVDSLEDLDAAIEAAREHDPKLVIEAGIVGREIECAVLEGRGSDAPRTSLPGEIAVAGGDARVLRLQRQVRRTAPPRSAAPRTCRTRPSPGPRARRRGVRRRRGRGPVPGGLLLHRRRRADHQRDQHHARLHARRACTRRCGRRPGWATRN